ncbi:MAG: hypothetical protein ABIF19_04210 [Planctomycetota bacterium]
MGRYYWDSKSTIEDCTQLSIFKLKEFGLLTGWSATTLTWTRRLSGHESSIGIVVDTEDLYAKVNYTVTDRNSGEKTDYDYRISLATTPCHFGGLRYWFICPLSKNGVYCGRRVGTLYLAASGKYFGCRHCYDLSYESRNETRSGMFGAYGGVLRAERQTEDLRSQIKRWTWRGRPTRKVRRLEKLEKQESRYLALSRPYLSR